jgi:hypothetical protein
VPTTIVLAAVDAQDELEGGQQRHEQRRLLLLAEFAQVLDHLRFDPERLAGAGVTRSGWARPIDRQLQAFRAG